MDNKKGEIQKKIDGISEQIRLLNQLKSNLEDNLKVVENMPVISDFEKVGIFKNLFIGRPDVFAKLWISKKTGKKGYSPVCKNEWAKNICIKPAGK